ncbi:hypothetical protein K1719_017838 [Acacia pycnantha]|nr:hypothetical protein K1719_017838 [Acacia pycnantha]
MDAYLNVARWRPDFCPKNAKIESVVAWVRLPDLPAPLFDKKFLLNLGNAIGKAIRLDVHTAQRARGKFARLCVELDLTKPLIPEFNVEGQVLSVVYESLGLLCNRCGWVGHNKEGCVEFHRKNVGVGMDVEGLEKEAMVGKENEGEKELWKTVHRAGWRKRPPVTAQPRQSGSRFSVLEEVVENEGVQEGDAKQQVLREKVQGVTNLRKDEVPNQQSKKGVNGGMGVKSRGLKEGLATRKKAIVKEGQQDALEKDKSLTACNRPGRSISILSESQNKARSAEDGGSDLTLNGQKVEVNVDDPIECYGTNVVVGGAASKGFAAVLRDLKHRHRLDMVVILEPRVSGIAADRVIKSWGFKHSVRKEAEGFSGGIWILWSLEDLVVDIVLLEEQFIHCNLALDGMMMAFTAVYASPNEAKRHRIWDILYNTSIETNGPWLLAGDFNEIKTPFEQRGGGRVNETRCRTFKDWIQDCNLIDIDAHGPFFTWKGPKWNGLDRVHKRLDRCLCNAQWQEAFGNADVKVIPRVCSDHHPIIVSLAMERKDCRNRPFRYEIAWQMHAQFDNLIMQHWSKEEEVQGNLNTLRQELVRWNRETFGQIEWRWRKN